MHGGDGGRGGNEGNDQSTDVLTNQLYMKQENYKGTANSAQEGLPSFYDPTLYDTHQDSQSDFYCSPQSSRRKGKGGRKKNLNPPTPTIMKHRRGMANARERKRMNGLNGAFERLREVVPNVNTEQKMSKIETLLVAQTYIKALAKIMETEVNEELESLS